MADQISIDAIANQALKSLGKLGGDLAGYAQLLVLLLANETGTIIHRDPDSALIGLVCTAPMPQAAIPDQNASAFHFSRNGLDLLASVFGPARILVAARHDTGGAVRFRKIRDRPHAVANHRRMGPLQRDDLIVGVNRLRLFARTDTDRGDTGDQTPVVENAFDDR